MPGCIEWHPNAWPIHSSGLNQLRSSGAGSSGGEHQDEKLKWNTAERSSVSCRDKILYLQRHSIPTSTASSCISKCALEQKKIWYQLPWKIQQCWSMNSCLSWTTLASMSFLHEVWLIRLNTLSRFACSSQCIRWEMYTDICSLYGHQWN